MALKFRNLDVDPSDPVEMWGPEGLLAAVDRGDVRDWARIFAVVDHDPYGEVAETLLEDVYATASSRGVAEVMARHVHKARRVLADREKTEVAQRVRDAIETSGLTAAGFARRIGTSPSRLSTYATGKTTPSAAMLLRIERAATAR